MALLNFGDFQLDVTARRIYTASGELAVEPKMFDVLCYLIQHSERYVSLQELHAEVWAGRIVTDTAVRRIISKLRAILGDTDPDAPLYIKSQMKRGYQFIGQQLPDELEKSEPPATAEFVQNSSVASAKIVPSTRKKTSLIGAGLLLVLSIFSILLFQWWQGSTDKKTISTEPLVSIIGEKHFLSVSEDGRYHAFTGRLNKNEGWQPYLYDSRLGQLQKMERPTNAVFPFVSVINNEQVIVSTESEGKSTLNIYSITDLNKVLRSIQLKDFSRVGQVIQYKDNVVLINGLRKDEKNFVYYLLNLDDESLKQFTYSSLQRSIDFNLAFSPDKEHFALIRRGADYQVQLFRTNDKTVLAEESFDYRVVPADEINLLWLDSKHLLINGGDKFKVMDIESGNKQELKVASRFSGLGRDGSGRLYGLLKSEQKSTFFQIMLDDLTSIQRYFSFNEQVVSLSYSQTPNKLWLVEKDNHSYLLNLYHPDTGEKKFYFKSSEPFSVIEDEHNAAYLLLWFNNKQLKLFDHISGTLTDISDVNQRISFPTFTSDKNSIFFSEKNGDEWQVNAFDRKALVQKRVLKGYRLLLPWNKQFVGADSKGKFYLLDEQYNIKQELKLNVAFNLMHQISLHGNKLIIANIGSDSNWKLGYFDLVTFSFQQQTLTTLPINTKFSFNRDGTSAIVNTENNTENQLVKLGYNLGYN
jgi:DNA-binding winged helix-turn-helix (wHTH) protein